MQTMEKQLVEAGWATARRPGGRVRAKAVEPYAQRVARSDAKLRGLLNRCFASWGERETQHKVAWAALWRGVYLVLLADLARRAKTFSQERDHVRFNVAMNFLRSDPGMGWWARRGAGLPVPKAGWER